MGHKVTSEMKLPVYNGEFGKATAFISQMKELLNQWEYDKSEYFTMLVSQCKTHAFKTIQRKRPMFGSDFEKHAEYLISYYDKGDSKDKKYTNFMARMHQQQNESTQIFRQRFDETATELIEFGSLISYDKDPEGHVRQQADLFLSKLNTQTREYVQEQLEKAHKTLSKTDIEELFNWAVESEKKKNCGPKNDTSACAIVQFSLTKIDACLIR